MCLLAVFTWRCHSYNMHYKGLSIETNAVEFREQLHNVNEAECEADFNLDVRLQATIIVVSLDMQYYRTNQRLTPIASTRTTLKFWTNFEPNSVVCSEKLLFAVKTLHRFTCFLLFQKLTERGIQGVYLPTPTDQELYQATTSNALVKLAFDEHGRYPIGL